MSRIDRSTDVRAALRSRQRGFLLNPFRFGGGGGGGDPYFADVELLLHMDGTNGSTSFPDSSSNSHTVTATGNAQVTTANSQFGGASSVFDGSGDYLTAGSAANWTFLHDGSKWTIEFWMRITVYGSFKEIFNTADPGTTTSAGVACRTASSNRMSMEIYRGATGNVLSYVSPTNSIPADTNFHHYALTYDHSLGSNNFSLYVDGTLASSGSKLANAPSSSSPQRALTLGGRSTSAAASITGNIDEFRVTKNVIRYTSNFSVPTEAHPDS